MYLYHQSAHTRTHHVIRSFMHSTNIIVEQRNFFLVPSVWKTFFSAKYCFISNCLKLLLIHCHRTNDWFILFRMQFRIRTLEQMCCCWWCFLFCYGRIMSHIKSVCFIYFIESEQARVCEAEEIKFFANKMKNESI